MHADQSPIDFDEAWYLLNNPDVAKAVEAGEVDSGLVHYIAYGRAEGRKPHAQFDAAGYANMAARRPPRDGHAKGSSRITARARSHRFISRNGQPLLRQHGSGKFYSSDNYFS